MGTKRFPVGIVVMVPVVLACAFYAVKAANPVAGPHAGEAAAAEAQPPCPAGPAGDPLPCFVVDADPEAEGLQRSATAPENGENSVDVWASPVAESGRGQYSIDVWALDIPEPGLGRFHFLLTYDDTWLQAETPWLNDGGKNAEWSCRAEAKPAASPNDGRAVREAFVSVSCTDSGAEGPTGDVRIARVTFTVTGSGSSPLAFALSQADDPSGSITLIECDDSSYRIGGSAGSCLDAYISNRDGAPVAYTGNADADAVIDALLRRDSAGVDSLLEYRQRPCADVGDVASAPCLDGESEGTLIDTFLGGSCAPQAVRAEDAPPLVRTVFGQTLHAVYSDSRDDFGVAADYALLFAFGPPEDYASSTIVYVAAGRIIGIVGGCDSVLGFVYGPGAALSRNYASPALLSALAANPVPTPQPTPSASHGPFHANAWVRVNAGAGDCLNARYQPSLTMEFNMVNACLPDGFEGMLTGGASEADGHWWWFMAGIGYVAEDYLTYVRDVDPRGQPLTTVPGNGRVAFVRDGDIWVLDAAGQRMIVDNPWGETSYPAMAGWSPDGSMLAYNVYRYGVDAGTTELHIVDPQGSQLLVVQGAAGGGWAPDGTAIGIVKDATPPQMGGGSEGVAGWLELGTGAEHLFGSERFYYEYAPAFNRDGSLLMATHFDSATGRSSIVIVDRAGGEVHRIDPPQDVYYGNPRWAPNDNRIAFHVSEQDRPRYAVYDIASASFVAEAAVPKANPNIGGSCGGADMWRLEWRPDGGTIAYSYGFGEAGANGVWTWDLATGEQRVVPASFAGPATWGPASAFIFEASGHLFLAGPSAAAPQLLTEGGSPVWWPGTP